MLATDCFELNPTHAAPSDNTVLQVQLPSHWVNFFAESGYLETVYGEQRRNTRLRVRCETIMECDFVPAFVCRPWRHAKVLLKDLSKTGLGLLCHTQMFPGETFWVQLHDRRLHVRVVRCRKIAPLCFEVGGIVTQCARPHPT
jgi:hypothetical protein